MDEEIPTVPTYDPETTAKGTGLAEPAGNEELVELRCHVESVSRPTAELIFSLSYYLYTRWLYSSEYSLHYIKPVQSWGQDTWVHRICMSGALENAIDMMLG